MCMSCSIMRVFFFNVRLGVVLTQVCQMRKAEVFTLSGELRFRSSSSTRGKPERGQVASSLARACPQVTCFDGITINEGGSGPAT